MLVVEKELISHAVLHVLCKQLLAKYKIMGGGATEFKIQLITNNIIN